MIVPGRHEGTFPYVYTLSILSYSPLSSRLPQNNEQRSLGYTVILVFIYLFKIYLFLIGE